MGVIFDLDGTLIDSISMHAKYLKMALDKFEFGNRIPYSFVKKNIRVSFSAFCKILSSYYKIKIDENLMRDIIKIKDEIMVKEGIKNLRMFSYSRETIKFLLKKKVNVCIASSINSFELKLVYRKIKLDKLGVDIINSNNFKLEKPNPYILNESINRYKMNIKNTCYVGDSVTDAITAKRAGISFIGVYNKELSNKGLFFRNMKEVYNYFNKNYYLYYDS